MRKSGNASAEVLFVLDLRYIIVSKKPNFTELVKADEF